MKNRIIKILAVFALIAGILSVLASYKQYCFDPAMWEALGGDPNESSSFIPIDDLNQRTEQAALTHPELFTDEFVAEVRAKYGMSGGGSPTASTPSASAPATSSGKGKSGKTQESKKITVYFTDLYGHVIGSSQVTAGTTIADSQFPKSVEDVDGHSFDKWDYDGKEMYHDYVLRALYK